MFFWELKNSELILDLESVECLLVVVEFPEDGLLLVLVSNELELVVSVANVSLGFNITDSDVPLLFVNPKDLGEIEIDEEDAVCFSMENNVKPRSRLGRSVNACDLFF